MTRLPRPALLLAGLIVTVAPSTRRALCAEETGTQLELTAEQTAEMTRLAKEFAKENRLKLAREGQLAHAREAVTILPFTGKWYRVRLSLEAGKGGPIIHQLLISTDGWVVDAIRHEVVVWDVFRNVLPTPKTEAEHLQYLKHYILAISAYDTYIISKPEDIKGYAKRPLDKDLEGMIRAPWTTPWTIPWSKRTHHVFYTYTREGGTVKRWKCDFTGGRLRYDQVMQLASSIGDAILHE